MVMDLKENFSCGRRLRQLRQACGYSQEELALRAEITTAYVGQIERGLKNPTVAVIESLCRAMNLSLAEFFQQEGETGQQDEYYLSQVTRLLAGKSQREKEAYLQLLRQVEIIQRLNGQ